MTQYFDPYDINHDAVIQLSLTLHTLYDMVHGVSPEDFPIEVCPCLDCLYTAFSQAFPEGTIMRVGRSKLFPEQVYVEADSLTEPAASVPDVFTDADIEGLE